MPAAANPLESALLAADIERVGRLSSLPTLLQLITTVTGLRLSLIARVTPERWICCGVNDTMGFGLKVGQELEVATTLCAEVRDHKQPIVIADVPNDPEYREHHTPRIYGLKSYIAVPIFLQDGTYFGNVCALDSEPREIKNQKTIDLLHMLAQLVSMHLAAEAQHEQRAEELSSVKMTAKERDQFIAILGHDVRTPLSSIVMSAEVLARKKDPDIAKIGTRILSSGLRVGRLMSDVLDFARGRMGGGISITRKKLDVKRLLTTAVDEAVASHAEHAIMLDAHDCVVMNIDGDRVQQVITNLIANAVQHGKPGAPILVDSRCDHAQWTLTVSNEGEPIPESTRARLFEPYVRGEGTGLGLGLYIVSQIVKAHGGTVEAHSPTAKRNSFVCRFPIVA